MAPGADRDPARRAQVIIGPPLELPPVMSSAEKQSAPKRTLFRPPDKFVAPEDGHDHRLPLSLQALVIVSFLGLAAAVVIMLGYINETNRRIERLEDYVAGRGEYRDREAARLKEELRRNWCEVLDNLPAAPSLDRLRTKFECEPAMAPANLHRAELHQPSEPTTSYSIELDREPPQTRGETRAADPGTP